MGKTTDTRERMVDGAKELIRKNGYGATSFKDVWEYTDTPRGSVYFHFPGGKEQLGLEVLASVGQRLADLTDALAARTRTAKTLVRALAAALADEVEGSDYLDGCAIVNISSETAASSETLRQASAAAFAQWTAALAWHFERFGMSVAESRRLADVVVSGLEGARVVAKTYRDRAALERMGQALSELV
jgi:TetR/AcrR family transcriptional repressor of lmrAB and yxaGH operons